MEVAAITRAMPSPHAELGPWLEKARASLDEVPDQADLRELLGRALVGVVLER